MKFDCDLERFFFLLFVEVEDFLDFEKFLIKISFFEVSGFYGCDYCC